MILKIVDAQKPSLRVESKEVGVIDKRVKDLIADMFETLKVQKDPEGVGLAAPQVGKNIRLFVIDYQSLKRVVINPVIVSVKTKKQTQSQKKQVLEGCLSLPHFYGPLKRADSITITYQNETGEKVTETFTGFHAQIIEHEIDHLNGILFVDRILEQKAPLYKFDGDDWEEVELI